ncbi:proteasome assembly chaperone family protein [Demequina sp.]|uniref:proteasome assembly chaperone family protein n=1 Tax=Demequina sp. TaxID=2050685 RepID=UPI003D140889
MEFDPDNVPIPADETLVIAAFEGWNDAGNAASAAVDHLIRVLRAKEHATLDPEDYHDFQVNRPIASRDEHGERVISWPGTVIYTATWKGDKTRKIILIRGIEPSMRWRQFSAEVLDYVRKLGGTTLLTLGALLVDSPHTRPLPVYLTSEDAGARERLDLERSDYDGPTGIVGVIGHDAQHRGLTTYSLWVGIPHYIAHPPSPMGTVQLLGQVELLVREELEYAGLADDAEAWENGADELMEEDEEIAAHVAQLESMVDEAALPEASGDAIAAEFEKYLRRRDFGK